MTVYELHTNEGTRLVRNNPHKGMMPYIKQKLAEGMKLSQIIYCWCPRAVHQN
jgi:hypothetical protein